MQHKIIIIGAGPAGLTAAYELQKAGIKDITLLEESSEIGGISRTINYKGNRIDIGGHRFFSKSDWVMDWWRDILPIALPSNSQDLAEFKIAYQGASRLLGFSQISARESDTDVLLIRNRLSRIYYGGQFFDYPLKPGLETARKLGLQTCIKFGTSYAYSKFQRIEPERTLEDFFINRFGNQLYRRFFKEYTEKVWGVPCNQISADWGAQRIKSLSIGSAVLHGLKKALNPAQKVAAQTSLIENFLYPKLGPGQLWEVVAAKLKKNGARILFNTKAIAFQQQDSLLTQVNYQSVEDQHVTSLPATHVISTMPIKDLVAGLPASSNNQIKKIAHNLEYRDFITVGVLYKKMLPTKGSINQTTHITPDNWIYIQEPGVKVGRLQIFNNWSPYMVNSPDTVWVGLEFFAREDDDLWSMSDKALEELALKEMEQLKLASRQDALDCIVIRQPKAYPGYYGAAYEQFDQVKDYLDGIKNLFLIGRNGMHRYNNQDHSMLSAKVAVENILNGTAEKANIWNINIGDDYHEG